ncbi:YobI family P-loop NTPase, partial [Snodgrassella alvi]|uniref:YobI family P-loop NTPase n=1 Tax=Snodgrassella alvi TaxID=1196083 RepID=UPI00403C5EA7
MEQTDDNKDSSTQETANKESQSKESQSKESQSKESQSKESQSKESQSKESQSKASQSKASQSKASQNKKSPKQLTFETLTPTNLSETEMQGYTQALDFIFKEDDLRNIAITGPYASGKSSVIKTYVNKHYKLKGIYISLAYFSPALESKIKRQKQDNNLILEDELIIEKKIINQLIHQIDPKKIPYTTFAIKCEPITWKNIIWAVIISVLIFGITFFDKACLTNLQSVWHTLVLIIILVCFCFTVSVIYKAIDLQIRKSPISKLKVFENEINISSSKNEVSYFDKYLDEIIYLLSKSQLDYIVFEDIDRYDDNLILNKLKELNFTYKKKHSKNNLKPIKFLYLIKDEIFESKDRTKFFDYILPIVPVMDNANSLGKIEQIFKTRNIRKDFSTTFLDTLSLYLDDIRLIKNICNEYIIYKTKIAHNDNEFKHENLLAIIVYKNMFPADFSLTRLGNGQGVVHRIIDSLEKQKKEYCQEEIQKIDDKINHLKQDVQSGGRDKSSAREAEQKLIEEKKRLKLPNKITEFIEIKQNEGIQIEELFEKHIKEKTKQPEYKAEYEKLSFSCYFPLLRVLIIQGYIDEYYSDNTSAYNEHGLPRNDTLFLRNIYESRLTDEDDWKLELTKPELVLKRLTADKAAYFNYDSVLNYSLLDYILITRKVDQLNNLSLFIRPLQLLHNNQVQFFNKYLARYYSLLIKETITLVSLQAQTLSQIQVEILLQKMKIKIVLPQIQVKYELVQEARAQAQEARARAQAQEARAQAQEARAQAQEARAQAQETLAQAQAQAQAQEARTLAQTQTLAQEVQRLEARAKEVLAQEARARAQEARARAQEARALAQEALARTQEARTREAQAREAQVQEARARARAQEARARAQEAFARTQEAQVQEALTQGLEARAQAQEARAKE